MQLTQHEREILARLDIQGGFTTGEVAKGVTMFGRNARTHSAAVRAWLINLKRRGFVAYLDDQRPVCWKKTEAGEMALTVLPSQERTP